MTGKDRLKCTVSCLVAMVIPSALTSLAALCQKHRTPNEISMEALVMLAGGPIIIAPMLAIDYLYTAATKDVNVHPVVRVLLQLSAWFIQEFAIPTVGKKILQSDVDEARVRSNYCIGFLMAVAVWLLAKTIACCKGKKLPQIFHFPSHYVPRVQQDPLLCSEEECQQGCEPHGP